MSHKPRLTIPFPALAAPLASLALLALLAAPGCSPSLNRYQSKTVLRDLPELKDVQKEIDFQDLTGSGPDNAIVTAKVDAIGTAGGGERHIIVDDEGDAMAAAEPQQCSCLLQAARLVTALVAILNYACAASDGLFYGG